MVVAPCSYAVYYGCCFNFLAARIRAFCESMSANIAATLACLRSSSVHKNGYSVIKLNFVPLSAVTIRANTLAVRNATAASSCRLRRWASMRASINACVSPHVHCHTVKRSAPCPTASFINSSTVYGFIWAGAFRRFPVLYRPFRSTLQTAC